MSEFILKEKLILITGASSGIGRACAIEFAKHDTNIALVARNTKKLKSLKKKIEHKNIQVEIFTFDLFNTNKIPLLIKKIEKKFSQSIDVLLNCAGYAVLGNIENIPYSAYKKNLELNFFAPLVLTKNIIPKMKKKKSGQIINLISGVGNRGLPGVSSYCVTKFALNGFSESLRVEMSKYHIDVITISPGLVKTAFNKNAKIYGFLKKTFNTGIKKDANIIAREIAKASIRRKKNAVLSFKTLFGIYLSFFFPGFLDNFLYKKFFSK